MPTALDLGASAGGAEASVADFPWMAALGSRGKDGRWRHQCSGSLVAASVVLTAAHCFIREG